MRLATFVAGTFVAVVVLSVVVAMQEEPQVLWGRPFATAPSTAAPEPPPTAQSLGCQGSYASMADDDVVRPTTADVVRFLGDFMEARVAGEGAETCLAQGALDTYRAEAADTYDPDADPQSLCLYACGDVAVSDFRVEEGSVLQADANSFEAEVEVVLGRHIYLERLTVGVGEAVRGGTKDLVVRSVSVESRSG